MKLWNTRPEQANSEPDRLREIAAERIAAAERLDAALVEVERSIEALLAADDQFFEEVRKLGHNDQGAAGNLRRLLRMLIVGQMQNGATSLLRILDLPYQPVSTRGQIADAVARITGFDLDNFSSPLEQKESAQ